MNEAVEGFHGTDVGIQTKLLAHGQQTLLGAHLGRGVVVKLRVADRGEQHGVGLLAHLEGLFGEGITHFVDGMGAAEGFLVAHFVTELLGYGTQHGHTLFHNLGADTVTGQHCNLEFHIALFF